MKKETKFCFTNFVKYKALFRSLLPVLIVNVLLFITRPIKRKISVGHIAFYIGNSLSSRCSVGKCPFFKVTGDKLEFIVTETNDSSFGNIRVNT